MNLSSAGPEEIVSFALSAMKGSEKADLALLDALPAPLYTTDAEGRITYFNRACIAFSGRTPVAGSDHWCVTWKLRTTDGAEMPHDECPMAVAIKEGRPIRGAEGIAERPDGSQVRFVPFPTPMCDETGKVLGAVNVLVDVAQGEKSRRLREQAQRCRRLARGIDDKPTRETLTLLAQDYEDRASTLVRLN